MPSPQLPHVEANKAQTDKQSAVSLRAYTTFSTQAVAKRLYRLNELSQLKDMAGLLCRDTFIVLGSGANVLFADDYSGTVVINRLKGIDITPTGNKTARVYLAAGEIWHDAVVFLSQRGYYGLENLALIPGTAGAAPIQNIGAYGVEIADFIKSVSVFDLDTLQSRKIAAADCGFAYRDSYFKQSDWQRRYVIIGITLCLSSTFSPKLSYQGLCQPDRPQTAADLLARVIAVRQSKLPDPHVLPNAGSFFKNPITPRSQLSILQKDYPDIPYFELNETHVKIPAAWLIQTAGFKGYRQENGAGVYDNHALILVNHAQAHGREIYALACAIMTKVKDQFNINLSPEVRIIGATGSLQEGEIC